MMTYTIEEFSKVLSEKINVSSEDIQRILESFSDILIEKITSKKKV
jgi:nucleoid DNA-binding protein